MSENTENRSGIFRKKALDRISSPEQLTDYLKVAKPGIWLLLAAVVILLAGIFVWSLTGNLETVSRGTAVVKDGRARIVMSGSDIVESGMTVRIADKEYMVSEVKTNDEGSPVCLAAVDLDDGQYEAGVVVESIHPISFLLGN